MVLAPDFVVVLCSGVFGRLTRRPLLVRVLCKSFGLGVVRLVGLGVVLVFVQCLVRLWPSRLLVRFGANFGR